MLKILIVPMLLVTFSVAETGNQTENQILKLKLEIYQLKEKNAHLQQIIDKKLVKPQEVQRRADAIAQLKRDLRKSRAIKVPQVMLLR